jgi:hypothetical protein
VERINLMPEAWVDGGGLWSNKTGTFTNCHWESSWNASGKRTTPSPAFVTDFVVEDENEIIEAGWSMGKADNAKASEDGVNPAPTGDYVLGNAIIKGTNFQHLLDSLVRALPDEGKQEKMRAILGEGRASHWNGLKAHLVRVDIEREGLMKKKSQDGKEYGFNVVVIDTILSLPSDKKVGGAGKASPAALQSKPAGKAAKAAAAPAAASAPTAAEASAPASSDLDEIARGKCLEALMAAGGAMSRADLAKAVYAGETNATAKAQLMKKVFVKEWLEANAEAAGFTFDAATDTASI